MTSNMHGVLLIICQVTWSYLVSSPDSSNRKFDCSEDMDLSSLRQQILSSSKTASEKAEDLLLESKVNDLSKDEWRELIAGIPADVKKQIGMLKPAGTHFHLHVWLKVQMSHKVYHYL